MLPTHSWAIVSASAAVQRVSAPSTALWSIHRCTSRSNAGLPGW